jgi:hypothetical protein
MSASVGVAEGLTAPSVPASLVMVSQLTQVASDWQGRIEEPHMTIQPDHPGNIPFCLTPMRADAYTASAF